MHNCLQALRGFNDWFGIGTGVVMTKSMTNAPKRFERLLQTRKKIHLTQALYELLYIHSNMFIAHFDRDGFFKARIADDEGFGVTVGLLATTREKPNTSAENRLVNQLIRIAKDNTDLVKESA